MGNAQWLSVGCDFLTGVDITAPSFLKNMSLLTALALMRKYPDVRVHVMEQEASNEDR
jgi:hypothetical protein